MFSKSGKISVFSSTALPRRIASDLSEKEVKFLLAHEQSKHLIGVIFNNRCQTGMYKEAYDPKLIEEVRADVETQLAFIDSLGYDRALLLTPGHSNTRTGWFVFEDRKAIKNSVSSGAVCKPQVGKTTNYK